MKNIQIIKTDKPSRLVKNDKNLFKLCIQTLPLDREINCFPHHIYIISDEDIKQNDYGLGFAHGIKGVGRGHYIFKQDGTNKGKLNALCKDAKKIILTTDPDLIADGVQAIDDEFLEWFIKNPSCEEVEVGFTCRGLDNGTLIGEWRITIPKEEPMGEISYISKEKLLERFSGYLTTEQLEMLKEESKIGIIKSETKFLGIEYTHKDGSKQFVEYNSLQEESKQETLEEAALEYAKSKTSHKTFQETHKRDFIAGAKSNAAKDYWFEQFKKK